VSGLRRAGLAAACAIACAAAPPAGASVLGHCIEPAPLSAAQQDRLLRFAGIVRAELEASGQRLALVARSGLDLSRFGQRYSHAGISLKSSGHVPWSVRQLYYACDEDRPKIFDEGLAGFVRGTDDPALGYVSAVLLPEAAAAPVERAALDDRQALQLLGERYSANAFAFSVTYQNCNQWVLELLARAWGAPKAGPGEADGDPARAQAQRWLQARGYTPAVFDVGNPLLMALAGLMPWLNNDDHPPEDRAAAVYRVSMPASIEAFVQAGVPGALRLEFCHDGRQVVVRRGWAPIADGCRPSAGDRVIALD
jgi:hypothetical protein